jgi:NAD(P)-dependent dehydrogenase (short-subunit alcohol dehydrogenase family)
MIAQMSNMQGKVCLATGATYGIGRVTAVELARMGATVVIVARKPARTEETREDIRAASTSDSVDLLLSERLWRLDEELVGFGACMEASSQGATQSDWAC